MGGGSEKGSNGGARYTVVARGLPRRNAEGGRRPLDTECIPMLKAEGSRRPLEAERRERSNTSLSGTSETVGYQ